MQNEPFNHKVADIINQLWPFLIVMGTAFMASLKMWWSDRSNTKDEIKEIRRLNLWLKENSVTHKELRECREDVRRTDEANIKTVFANIDEIRKDIKDLIREVAGAKQ